MKGQNVAGLLMAGLALGSCDLAYIATSPSSEYSYISSKAKMKMALVASNGKAGGINTEDLLELSTDAQAALFANCRPKSPDVPRIAAAGGEVVLALAGILFDIGIAQAQAYVEKEAEKFTASYTFKVNVESLSLPPGNKDPRLKCIVVQRTIELADEQVELPAHQEYLRKFRAQRPGETKIVLPAMTLGFALAPMGNAYVMKPIFIDLNYAAARTFQETNAVNLGVSVGISVLQPGRTQQTTRLLTLQNYSLSKVELPNVKEVPLGKPGEPKRYQTEKYVPQRDAQGRIVGYRKKLTPNGPLMVETRDTREPYDKAKFSEGTIIPPLNVAVPATIVVSVVETGDGAEAFEKAGKEIDAASDALKSLGLEQLKKGLGVD